MDLTRITTVAALTFAMAAPGLAQVTPRPATTRHSLHEERLHRAARYHSGYCYDGDEDGVIADLSGENPFGAPPSPWWSACVRWRSSK
jgi:hypothetical protein